MTYLIGNTKFKNKNELFEYVKSILKRYNIGDVVNKEDMDFMINLLYQHPNVNKKTQYEITSIYISDNPIYPGNKSKGFHLRYIDGSSTDFSYRKCINIPTHRLRVISACRAAVDPYIFAFKQTMFKNGNIICPDTQQILTFKTCHVDHKAPYTFATLIDMFLKKENITFDEIKLKEHENNQYCEQFQDTILSKKWIDFHNKYACLEIVSTKTNLSTRRKNYSYNCMSV